MFQYILISYAFVSLPVSFCFRILKYFTKSNALTISLGWSVSTVNIWLLDSIIRITWPLTIDETFKKCDVHSLRPPALYLLYLYGEEERRKLLKKE